MSFDVFWGPGFQKVEAVAVVPARCKLHGFSIPLALQKRFIFIELGYYTPFNIFGFLLVKDEAASVVLA